MRHPRRPAATAAAQGSVALISYARYDTSIHHIKSYRVRYRHLRRGTTWSMLSARRPHTRTHCTHRMHM